MSEVKVNKISPRTNCGTVQLGDSGDTITIPAGATITNSGTQTGFGRTGTVDWVTSIKTNSDSPLTVANGKGYFLNTTGGTITVNLPAGSAGDIVAFKDYANTWDTSAVTVTPNGTDKIGGVNANVSFGVESQSVTLIFTDSTRGWLDIHDSTTAATGNAFIVASGGTESTSGDDKIHTFTGPGTFTVSAVAQCAANNLISHLMIGGGGGGQSTRGGGGGAGGFREVKSPATPYSASPLDGYPSAPNRVTVTAQSYAVVVGGGGVGGSQTPTVVNTTGVNTTFAGLTAAGGGRGGGPEGGGALAGGDGGSGGGAYNPGSAVGSGNTPPVSPPQGQNGGTGAGAPNYGAGGGGGAGAVGNNGSTSGGGNGGAGVSTSITGSSVARAGGGGGGSYNTASKGCGGAGGGGTASPGAGTPYVGDAGSDNTGGGGGGNSNLAPGAPGPGGAGGNGGSGIVVIRYKIQ